MGDQNIAMIKSDVDKSAAAIGTAADHVAGIDVGAGLAKVAEAMFGTVCVGSANAAKTSLVSRRDGWVKKARQHHDLTHADAANIHATDEEAQARAYQLQQSVGATSAGTPSSGLTQRFADRLGGV